MPPSQETPAAKEKFDFAAYPPDTLFHERRTGVDRRAPVGPSTAPSERRVKSERRRRIDPTTFEKQYTDDELEFMNAMQRFKVQTGKVFPSHGDVIRVAVSLGYRRGIEAEPDAGA